MDIRGTGMGHGEWRSEGGQSIEKGEIEKAAGEAAFRWVDMLAAMKDEGSNSPTDSESSMAGAGSRQLID